MGRVYTSTIRYARPDRLDITVKGQDPLGKIFAPTWDMVMGHKSGKYTDQQYTDMYYQMMLQSFENNKAQWAEILHREYVVLVCYCPAGKFCHRHILAEYLTKLGMSYGGEI